MHLVDLDSRLPISLPGVSKRTRQVRWWLAWPIALGAAVLMAGAVIAATDPDWGGTKPRDISHSPRNQVAQPVIEAGSSGRMVVVWSDQWSEGGSRDIYVTSSGDNGHTWSLATVVTQTADESNLPGAVIVGDQVFVTWCDQAGTYPNTAIIYEAEVVSHAVRRIPGPPSSTSTRPSLAASASRLHVVFSGGTFNQPDIRHAMRPLTATVWPTATVVYTHTGTGSWYPMLAIGPEENTLHMVWEERALQLRRAIMYMRGVVNGNSVDWTSPITLSTGITLSVWPAIAAGAGGNLHVVWGEQVGAGQVYDRKHYMRYTRYDEASGTWSAAVRIDPEPVNVNQLYPTDSAPSLTLLEKDGQVTVCVAWHGFREGEQVEPAEEVLLSCSRDGGHSWTRPQNMSRSAGEYAISIRSSIVFDALGQLHGVWQERTGEYAMFDYQVYHTYALSQVFLPLVMRN